MTLWSSEAQDGDISRSGVQIPPTPFSIKVQRCILPLLWWWFSVSRVSDSPESLPLICEFCGTGIEDPKQRYPALDNEGCRP